MWGRKKGEEVVLLTKPGDFATLGIVMQKGTGIVIGFWNLEDAGFFMALRQFIIGMSYVALGWAAAYLVFTSDIPLRYTPPGVPPVLTALLAAFVCFFGIPYALCVWTKISPVPPFLFLRSIQIDPERGEFRVYRKRRLEVIRPLSLYHTSTVEEHPKVYKDRLRGRVGKYSKQMVLYGWFGMAGAEKVKLFSRWEYPYQNSLIEVQKAIEVAVMFAEKLKGAADGGAVSAPTGFGGRMIPADDGGGRPPLD